MCIIIFSLLSLADLCVREVCVVHNGTQRKTMTNTMLNENYWYVQYIKQMYV